MRFKDLDSTSQSEIAPLQTGLCDDAGEMFEGVRADGPIMCGSP
jgi:hypothetical protein